MLKEKLAQLVADFRTSMKWWSMRLNVLASALIAYLIANPNDLKQASDFLPVQYRPAWSALCGVVMFFLVYVVRRAPQGQGKTDA